MTKTTLTEQNIYKLVLLKAYFEKGYSLLSYPKYVLFLIGLGDIIASGGNWKKVFIFGVMIGLLCFVIGWLMYKYKIVEAELEVNNQVNPFVKEFRELSGNSVYRKA